MYVVWKIPSVVCLSENNPLHIFRLLALVYKNLNSAGMGTFRLFDGSQGHPQESPRFGEKTFLCVLYNHELLPLKPQSCLRFYPDSVCPELALRHTHRKWQCSMHMCISCRLASKITAGKNKLVKFHNTILASCAYECMSKLVCFVRSSPCGPRSASMYEISLMEVAM